MAEFNITNSKVGQVNDRGDNYQIPTNRGTVAITADGPTVQSTGNENRVSIEKPKSNWLASLWRKVTAWWTGRPTA